MFGMMLMALTGSLLESVITLRQPAQELTQGDYREAMQALAVVLGATLAFGTLIVLIGLGTLQPAMTCILLYSLLGLGGFMLIRIVREPRNAKTGGSDSAD